MGLIAKIREVLTGKSGDSTITEVSADMGGGRIVTAQHVSAPGDDAKPLETDYVALGNAAGTGRKTAVGYSDPKNAPVAGPGEKRIYSRDSSGAIKAEAYLKKDGSIEIKNSKAEVTIDVNGKITLHSSSGEIDIKADGPTGKVAVKSINSYLGDEMTAMGIVTGQCQCAYTGGPHPVFSLHHKASM